MLMGIVVAIAAAVVLVALYLAFVSWRIARRAEAAVPPPGAFVTIDGDRIHYVDEGRGRPVVMIHGLGGTLFNFTYPLHPLLKDEFRLISIDRPGSGYSTRSGDGPASPSEQAAFMVRFIDALGLDRPLVVGHSLGGAIALALALDHPDKISGLALLAPLTHSRDAIPPEFAPLYIPNKALRWIISRTIAVPRSVKYRDATLAFVFGPQQPPDDYAIAGGAMIGLRPSHFYATATDCVAVADDLKRQQERYGEIGLPVSIHFGTADRVLNCDEHGRSMDGKLPGLQLELAEGVGHMPQYAEPERVAEFIRRVARRAFADASLAD